MTSLLDTWRSLGRISQAGSGWKSIRIFPQAPFTIRVALEEPTGRQALLIECNSMALSAVREYPSALGFECFPENILPGPTGKVRLCLALLPGFDLNLFANLAQDIAETISIVKDENEGIRALFSRLGAWQTFLRKYAEGLTIEEQIGLFGELSILQLLVYSGLPPALSILSWKGPEGGLHDFVFDSCEIEVKATIGSGKAFKVGHLAQLDDAMIADLILCHVALVLDDEGETLSDLVTAVRVKFSGAAAGRLEQLLLSAGYSDHHSHQYGLRRYKVSVVKYFKVHGDFPRILPSEVRSGVVDGSYSVDFRACQNFQLEQASVLKLIVNMGGVFGQ